MARRRITGGSLSFQPQAGSISREMDVITKRGADNITAISRRMKAQKEYERQFMQNTLNKADDIAEESHLMYKDFAAEKVAELKNDLFNMFAKRNKKGKVRGFDIYDPKVRSFAQAKTNEIAKIFSRGEPTAQAMKDAIKVVANDKNIIDKTNVTNAIVNLANDPNTLLSNTPPENLFLEIISKGQDSELIINSILSEFTKNDEISSKTFSKKEVLGDKNVETKERFDYNIDVVKVDKDGNVSYDEDKLNLYTSNVIAAKPLKFNKEGDYTKVYSNVKDFFNPKSSKEERISPVTGDGSGSGPGTSKVFDPQNDIVNYEFDEIDKSKITLKGFNFTKPIALRMKVKEDGVDLFKKVEVFGLRENIDGEKFVYGYTGKESIGDLEKIIAQYDLKKLLTQRDELLTEEEKKTKKELKEKIDGLDKLHVLTLDKAIEKDLIKSAQSQNEQEETINIGGLEHIGENSLFTEDERVNTFDTSQFNE